MAIEMVVFDIVGTVAGDQGDVNRVFRETLATHGLAAEPEDVDAVISLPGLQAFRILVGRSAIADTLFGRLDAIHQAFVSRRPPAS